MRTILGVLLALTTIAACTEHYDYVGEFRVQGTIKASSATKSGGDVTISVLDTGMDDQRSAARHAFLVTQVQEGVPFALAANYSWSRSDSESANATLAVRMEIAGCPVREESYRLAELPTDGKTVVVDLRNVSIECG